MVRRKRARNEVLHLDSRSVPSEAPRVEPKNAVPGRRAARAGGLALTWNYLWDVPFEPGTRLAGESFKSSGWGGISILWGAGVVDN